jgi:hypothetical protein
MQCVPQVERMLPRSAKIADECPDLTIQASSLHDLSVELSLLLSLTHSRMNEINTEPPKYDKRVKKD